MLTPEPCPFARLSVASMFRPGRRERGSWAVASRAHTVTRCHTLVAKSFLTPLTPEEKAREIIDGMLIAAGWIIQNRADANIDAGPGVAIREFSLAHGFGEADYLLFANGQAVGVVEAKKEGSTLTGFEPQTQKYSEGIPEQLPVDLLRSYPAEEMRAWMVSRDVGNVRNNDPSLVERLS